MSNTTHWLVNPSSGKLESPTGKRLAAAALPTEVRRKTIGATTYTLLAEDAGHLLFLVNNCEVTINDSLATDEWFGIYCLPSFTATLVGSGVDLIGSTTVSGGTSAVFLDIGGGEIARLF